MSCRHDGYLRLSDPVDTQRELTYDRRLRTLYVSDSLLCKRPHRLEMYWHFSEKCGVQIQSDLAIVNNANADAQAALARRIVASNCARFRGISYRGLDISSLR